MERETGIEPATSSLGSWRSTAELLPLVCANVDYHQQGPQTTYLTRQEVNQRDPTVRDGD